MLLRVQITIQETFRKACEKIHIMGYLQMGHIHITRLKPNQTDSLAEQPNALAEQMNNDV